jgi:hypothetical protein
VHRYDLLTKAVLKTVPDQFHHLIPTYPDRFTTQEGTHLLFDRGRIVDLDACRVVLRTTGTEGAVLGIHSLPGVGTAAVHYHRTSGRLYSMPLGEERRLNIVNVRLQRLAFGTLQTTATQKCLELCFLGSIRV